MMMPAWLLKLKDLKPMKSKQKQSEASLLSPPFAGASNDHIRDASMYFAKALSLQRANGEAQRAQFEGSLGYLSSSIDTDSIFSSSDNDAHMRMQLAVDTSADVPVQDTECEDSGYSFHAVPSRGIKVGPRLLDSKKRMVSSLQNDLYSAIDNYSEGSNGLSPNTIESSFGSESSSANSCVMHKCGYIEDSCRQRLMRWQEGDCLESLTGCMEASICPEEATVFSNWRDKSACGCNADMQDMSRPSNCTGAINLSKFPESSTGNLIGFCSLDMEAALRLTYTEGHLNWHGRSSQDVRDDHSLLSFYECHTNMLNASRNVPGCAFSVWYEGKSAAHCSLSCSGWEKRSALIAVENPGLMLSSKWRDSPCTLLNPSLASSAGADQSLDQLMHIEQDNRIGTAMFASPNNSIGLSMCVQQGNINGLSVCHRRDDGNAGFHKSVHEAYLRRGRRRRGSSFSAALPKDLQGVVGDSIALVKMSHNPYEDFRHSMYEMIMEKDLEGSMDVEELLYCYLSLNSPEHHELIEEVFSDVWSSILMSVR